MKLFDRFDRTYCMNLKRRPDRLEHFVNQVNKFDLGEYEYFEAVDGNKIPKQNNNLTNGEVGHLLSTIKILEDAINKNYKNILIVEDDCVFLDEVKNIDSYFNFLPNDWDMIYFGGNHNLHINVPPPKKINEKVVKLHFTYSSHCIGINSKMFQIILNNLKHFVHQTDVVYQQLQPNYNFYCFYPTIATQLTGYSDIRNSNVDYTWLIK